MYGYNNQYMLENLNKQKEKIEEMIRNYQNIQPTPVNNFINTNQQVQENTYELKKLNENEEVENIAIFKDTIFLGEDRLQIKKTDGTIEKFEIKKVYPRDKKDDKIDELTKKIEELERKLNNEPRKSNEPTKKCDEPNGYVNGTIEPTTTSPSEKHNKSTKR